ncbi:MAG: hypothetical protein DI535_00715 [Citrobacter freundii]|nr:MAG: hypothetical protein DI535_00715 [Citrobacter freundii]
MKLLYDQPEEAKAILAHELSHIAQRDTDLTILLKIFLKYVLSILLPIQLITAAPSLYYAYNQSVEHELEANRLFTYMLGSGDINDSYYNKEIDRNFAMAKEERGMFRGVLISSVILGLICIYLRRVVFNSERTADTAAAAITSPIVVKNIFQRILHDRKYKRKQQFWFTINPSIKWRLKKIVRLEKKFEVM